MLMPGPERLAPANGPLRVAFVGRIARQKGLPLLLQAFSGLSVRVGRAVVLDLIGPTDGIVGESDWRNILRAAEAASGEVRYLGVMTLPELRAQYAGMDLLVLPSTDRQESFGLVQVEAINGRLEHL